MNIIRAQESMGVFFCHYAAAAARLTLGYDWRTLSWSSGCIGAQGTGVRPGLQVNMWAERISRVTTTYVNITNKHILPCLEHE